MSDQLGTRDWQVIADVCSTQTPGAGLWLMSLIHDAYKGVRAGSDGQERLARYGETLKHLGEMLEEIGRYKGPAQ